MFENGKAKVSVGWLVRMSSGIPVWAEPYMAPRDEIQVTWRQNLYSARWTFAGYPNGQNIGFVRLNFYLHKLPFLKKQFFYHKINQQVLRCLTYRNAFKYLSLSLPLSPSLSLSLSLSLFLSLFLSPFLSLSIFLYIYLFIYLSTSPLYEVG